jgi:hypothetical protein
MLVYHAQYPGTVRLYSIYAATHKKKAVVLTNTQGFLSAFILDLVCPLYPAYLSPDLAICILLRYACLWEARFLLRVADGI